MAQIPKAPTNVRVSTGPVSAVGSPGLFDEALLGKSVLGHKRSRADWLISLCVHAAIVAAVVIVPIFYTQVIDLKHFEATYLVAPTLPAPPPPAAPAVAVSRQALSKVIPRTAKLTMPVAIPKTVPAPTSAPEAPPDVIAGIPGGVPGGVPGGQIGGVLGGVLGGTGPGAPPPPVAAAPAAPSGPLQVGGQVKRPREISKPAPDYPVLAKQSRIQGDVVIDAVIDKNGNVVEAHAMSGPPMLIAAALKAVNKWKYEPTYLNGVAYPVELMVHVNFSLSS